jgi:hypothetical protein
MKFADGAQSLNPVELALIGVVVQLLALQVSQGRVLFIIIFILLALLLFRLLSRGVLSLWALRHHVLYLKSLLLRYE